MSYEKEKLEELRRAIIREVGRMEKMNRLNKMPNVYYWDKSGLLKLIWKKQ